MNARTLGGPFSAVDLEPGRDAHGPRAVAERPLVGRLKALERDGAVSGQVSRSLSGL